MAILVRTVRDRQEAAAELYEALEEPPPWPRIVSQPQPIRTRPAEVVRRLLASRSRSRRVGATGPATCRCDAGAVERLGVLVMQSGDLPIRMMRGFASPHPMVSAGVGDHPQYT